MSIFNKIAEVAVRKAASAGLKLKAVSPEIAVGAGIVSLIGAGVLACVETAKKIDAVVDDHNTRMEKIREAKELAEEGEADLTAAEIKRGTFAEYGRTLCKAAIAYAPAIGLATIGTALIIFGHGQLKARYAAVVTTLEATTAAFKKYRKRWADKVGKEAEELVFKGAEKKLITTEYIDEKTGEKKQETKETQVVTSKDASCSPWCFIFDQANAPCTWNRRPGMNYAFLIQQQNWFNERLQRVGYVTLNQVLESLGMQPIREGIAIGWVSKGAGEGFVDFGIASYDRDPGCFSGGLPDYVLNFNCMGPVAEVLPARRAAKIKKPAKIRAKVGGKA